MMPVNHTHDTLVLIPAYNASIHLGELITRLRTYVCNSNLLVVNDGSTDDTQSILERENIMHLTLPANSGKGVALRAGFQYAKDNGYRSVLTLDADLQHLPEEIPRFFAADNGQRIALGVRRLCRRTTPFGRLCSNNLTSLVVSIFSSTVVRDSQCGFRLIPVALTGRLRLTADRYDIESQLLFQAGVLGYPILGVPVTTVYNGAESHISSLADIGRFIGQIWRRIWL